MFRFLTHFVFICPKFIDPSPLIAKLNFNSSLLFAKFLTNTSRYFLYLYLLIFLFIYLFMFHGHFQVFFLERDFYHILTYFYMFYGWVNPVIFECNCIFLMLVPIRFLMWNLFFQPIVFWFNCFIFKLS